jgi:hypothetical protein
VKNRKQKKENIMAENKKVVYAYMVMRNEDGSVDVKDAGLEGVEPVESAKIYEDIEAVAKLIELKRASDTAFAASYNAIAKFYQDLAAQQKAAQEASVAKTTKGE